MAICVSGPASAQDDPSKWLPPGSSVEATLSEYPARWIRSELEGGRMGHLARLGELVFRSPLTLGRDAARRGLACEACHPNGAANTAFFIPGQSDRPGNVDITHRGFNYREDDRIDNPVNIPSLRGVRLTAPFGRDGRFATLADFTRNVIMVEFGAAEPEPWMLDALVAFQRELALAPNEAVGGSTGRGRRTYLKHCADCHAGARDFAQGDRHDVGTGGYFEAPHLRGLAESAPYLHDGSAPDIRAAIAAHRDGITADMPRDAMTAVVAHVEAIGAVDRRFDPETLDGDIDRLLRFLELVYQPLLDEDGRRADRIGDMVLMEIGFVHRRFGEAAPTAQAITREWAKALNRLLEQGRAGDHPAARAQLATLIRTVEADRGRLRADVPVSLYAATAGE